MDYLSDHVQEVADCVAWSKAERAGLKRAIRELPTSRQLGAVGGEESVQGTCADQLGLVYASESPVDL